MYNTPLGIRILEGSERRLFAESLAVLVDDVSMEDEPIDSGAFCGLQRNQKVFVLHTVGRALLCADEPAPKLTAPIEAAVAAVFEYARSMISLELSGELVEDDDDLPEAPSWREMVATVCRESGIADELTNIQENEPDDWDVLLDCLADRVLWDRDFEMEEHLDVDPQVGQRVKSELGIDRDYFTAAPPEPSDAEADRLIAELRALTHAAE